MTAIEHPVLLTWDDYLAVEARSDIRHEFVGGSLVAMTGASARHEAMSARLIHLLYDAAQADGCQVLGPNMRLRLAPLTARYPDVAVYCEEDDPTDTWRERPCLLIEVISPSTASVDRVVKREEYLRISSLLTYLLVDVHEQHINAFLRPAPHIDWQVELHVPGSRLELACPAITLDISDVFSGI